jgi:acetyltransferase-like isoleucine patch superfamily enzyme
MMIKIIRIISKLPKHIKEQSALYVKWLIFKAAKNWVILNRIHPRLRPWLWKLTGVQIKGKVSIGYDVYYDVGNAKYIIIEDGVWVASRALLLCHKRILTDYCMGDDYNKLPYKQQNVILKKGCVVGMGAIVMPGVTIGEGAIIGAGSLVVKDIPAWTIAVGNPAKVVQVLKKREENA